MQLCVHYHKFFVFFTQTSGLYIILFWVLHNIVWSASVCDKPCFGGWKHGRMWSVPVCMCRGTWGPSECHWGPKSLCVQVVRLGLPVGCYIGRNHHVQLVHRRAGSKWRAPQGYCSPVQVDLAAAIGYTQSRVQVWLDPLLTQLRDSPCAHSSGWSPKLHQAGATHPETQRRG